MKPLIPYWLDSNQNIIVFKNVDRIPEDEIFDELIEILKSHRDMMIGEKKQGVLEEYCLCEFCGKEFRIINDVD